MTLDAGTTSNRCIIFDHDGNIVKMAQKEVKQIFPKAGWVEQDPNEIWSTQIGVCIEAINSANLSYENIKGIGITNQRETTILWDKNTGIPVYNAIVWQCRRTSEYCDRLKEAGYSDFFRKKTGLEIDAYFSATKVKWILDNVEGVREKAEKGEILFGTVDTWLMWKLSEGKIHKTDYSNASRTMLFNINDLKWDDEILELFDIPKSILAEVEESGTVFGYTDKKHFGGEIPISGVLGDQQAALFGQTCFEKGEAKATYGTGAFLLMNTGDSPIFSESGIVSTIGWGANGKVTYALEGSIFTAGSIVQWLRDEMRLIDASEDSEYMATKVEDTNGCYVVPAFTGLGAPYWNQDARGTICGITRGVNKYHIIRACLESIAYLSFDVFEAMEKDSKIKLKSLKVDGGASNNNFLMQCVSDMIQVPVLRPDNVESTALGASFMAGLTLKYWTSKEDILNTLELERKFIPNIDKDLRKERLINWKDAVKRSFDWEKQ